NFRWVYGDFAGLLRWDTGNHANSLYFEWLADTGVLGLAVFVWLGFGLLRASFTGVLDASAGRTSDNWRIWRLALAASLTAWFLHGLVDYFYEPLPTNLAFWLIGAIALAGSRRDSTACV